MDLLKEINKLVDNGYSAKQISLSLNIKYGTLKKYLLDNNIKTHGYEKRSKNHSGEKFGNLILLEQHSSKPHIYLCQCKCGNIVKREWSILLSSKKKNYVSNCGCNKEQLRERRNPQLAESRVGKKYNYLTIISIKRDYRRKRYLMVCLCECGRKTEQIYADIKSGKVKSCGCYQREQASLSGSKYGLLNSTKNCSKHRWIIKNKDNIFVRLRSSYEYLYAIYLLWNNIRWEYEPKIFKLKNGMRYTPDFYLPDFNRWVEIKGYIKGKDCTKHKLFGEMGNTLEVLFLKDIECLVGFKYGVFKRVC